MQTAASLEKAKTEGWTDEEVIESVKAGDTALYELVMRRCNQRLYRVARAILRDDAEAEDVMQDAYVRSGPISTFTNLPDAPLFPRG